MIDPGAGARSERRSRDETAKVAHSNYPLAFPLCRVPLLSPYQDGRTPLMVVKTPETAQALIAAGADVNVRDTVGST